MTDFLPLPIRVSRAAIFLVCCLGAVGGCSERYGKDAEHPATEAEAYTVEPTAGGIRIRDAEMAQRLFVAVTQGYGAPLQADGRLGMLAQQVGERLGPAGLLPEPEEIEFLTRRLGLLEPSPRIWLVAQGSSAEVAAGIEQALAGAKAERVASHFGMALARAYGRSFWVVILSQRQVALSPVPRKVDVGTDVRVVGSLPAGYKDPRVSVLVGGGVREDLPAGSGPAFDVRIPTPTPGLLQIELSAVQSAGRSMLALMPVYVGREPPSSWDGKAGAAPMTEGQATEALVKAVQHARALESLPPLKVDPALSQMAERHSSTMAHRAVVGHEVEPGQAPPDRVRAVGYSSGLVLENVGRSRDAIALHDDFLGNPGQRAAILHPQVTHLGVGVAKAQTGTGAVYYVTEVFVGVPEEIDPTTAPETVLTQINQARAAKGASPLKLDAALSAVAEDAVTAYFKSPFPSQQAVMEGANEELGAFSISYRKAAALMAIVSALSETATLEPALAPGATHIGIALAQKERPGTTGKRIAVVLTLGWER